tara:strand:- start:2680 stop:3180 length:501 start_codon:yes stop_codon:yes gene_type:complete
MKNSHLTRKKDFVLDNTKYMQEDYGSKPNGLWYQINDSWEEWCKHEMPSWLGPNNRGAYKVNIKIDKSNLLVISTLEEFDSFHETFCTYNPNNRFRPTKSDINWKKVSSLYDGIEISDYFYQRRMDDNCEWYYPWDIASGCIWNTDIIKVVGETIEIKEQEDLWLS